MHKQPFPHANGRRPREKNGFFLEMEKGCSLLSVALIGLSFKEKIMTVTKRHLCGYFDFSRVDNFDFRLWQSTETYHRGKNLRRVYYVFFRQIWLN